MDHHKEIDNIQIRIKKLKESNLNNNKPNHFNFIQKIIDIDYNNKYQVLWGFCTEIASAVIVAIILNNLYERFFNKNKLFFAILLMICITASLFKFFYLLYKNYRYRNNQLD